MCEARIFIFSLFPINLDLGFLKPHYKPYFSPFVLCRKVCFFTRQLAFTLYIKNKTNFPFNLSK